MSIILTNFVCNLRLPFHFKCWWVIDNFAVISAKSSHSTNKDQYHNNDHMQKYIMIWIHKEHHIASLKESYMECKLVDYESNFHDIWDRIGTRAAVS